MCPVKLTEDGNSSSNPSISPTSSMSSLTSTSSDSGINNHEEDDHFFEGVEKLLEVWFTNKDGIVTEDNDLRRIPRKELDEMLGLVKCTIISSTKNGRLDSYVLSESSMFISQRRFILKTCGTTTPLQCFDDLRRIVKTYAGFDTIEDIFYSRKNFERPELQMMPHCSFEQEVALLDEIFADGAAYCMGTMNRDCWYLYTLNPLDRYVTGKIDVEPDQSIEILMTELDPEVMKQFTKDGARNGQEATKLSGIDKLIPGMKIDDFLFDPCGYSMNGILKNGEYMTIHITPESEFSYVSFESNIPLKSYLGMIQRVLDTFQPGKFILTIFANRTSKAAESHKELQNCQGFGDWLRKDIQYSSFQNHELTYAHFIRFPS
eukprot:maker-scaffold123_size333416-snap-gene-2.18 protein:Tk05325 transcript:maker-scaffold123_size333416-snap-gene-2.18-mRNA-1 annotation:"s-adenosylmethionine decarboxylase proenzyme-like"